jgi:chromosome segregation ATPase
VKLTSIELSGFKSFAKKTKLEFGSAITAIVGPNGSGKSNVVESFRFVLGEQSMKSMRGKRGEDLIWNGSQAIPRAGRACVTLTFDNSDRALNLDFDEVTLERVVHRDGGNDYLLNGSIVRLRDISELLSQANIGASGHHIISQGEADHVLSAGPRERREMIEDALGLTAYLYKREEAERKLDKTGENMREVESLRRELMPHLKFLQSQVKKIEESHKLRDDLAEKYREYLKRESVYLRLAKKMLKEELEAPEKELKSLDTRIAHARAELEKKTGLNAGVKELMHLEEEGRLAREKRDKISRELGRIEGELAALERVVGTAEGSVPVKEAHAFAEHIEKAIADALSLDGQALKDRLTHMSAYVRDFISKITQSRSSSAHGHVELTAKKSQLEHEMRSLDTEERRIHKDLEGMRRSIENQKDASREAERELFADMARRSELEAVLATVRAKLEVLAREEESFKREVGEAAALVGREAANYEDYIVREASGEQVTDAELFDEDRAMQEDRRRKLERQKIRLEEIGGGNQDEILKEFNETSERDQFLARELEDLEQSAIKLRELIKELTNTLEVRFADGIEKINKEFDTFFKLMFGGGTAKLSLVKERKLRRVARTEFDDEEREDTAKRVLSGGEDNDDVEIEEGIDINITLPHKRIKGLHMLSGGERALTSIALIFAMSQVNPPPFLILDETDAALDEANSKRYGDMIETLAKHSQLIVITHNRETMSRAGILYGITMGNDGVSKLLSVKFEEAVAVAK